MFLVGPRCLHCSYCPANCVHASDFPVAARYLFAMGIRRPCHHLPSFDSRNASLVRFEGIAREGEEGGEADLRERSPSRSGPRVRHHLEGDSRWERSLPTASKACPFWIVPWEQPGEYLQCLLETCASRLTFDISPAPNHCIPRAVQQPSLGRRPSSIRLYILLLPASRGCRTLHCHRCCEHRAHRLRCYQLFDH